MGRLAFATLLGLSSRVRLRQNIASLRSVSGQEDQVQRYSRQLAGQESQLATMRDQIREQRKRKQTLEKELSTLLDKLEF